MPKRRTKTRAPGVFRSISGRYEILYEDSSGKLRSEVIGDNFEEAKAARADRMATMARGGKVVRTRDNFGVYAEDWIASLSRRPRTLDAYRYALDRHILPRFKNRRVADITPTTSPGWSPRCDAPATPNGRSAVLYRPSQAVSAKPCAAA